MKLIADSGWPSMLIRSRIDTRCGEVNRPVRRPRSRSSASIIRVVDVLPLVPVTCTTGYARCGSPSRLTSAATRSSVGSIWCSARRDPISSSTSRSRAAMSSTRFSLLPC